MKHRFSRIRRLVWGAGALVVTLSGGPTLASDAATVSMQAGTCAACHGTDGRSTGSIPAIAGKPFAVLKAQLDTFRSGEAQGATVMTRIVKGFEESELEALARYFADAKN